MMVGDICYISVRFYPDGKSSIMRAEDSLAEISRQVAEYKDDSFKEFIYKVNLDDCEEVG